MFRYATLRDIEIEALFARLCPAVLWRHHCSIPGSCDPGASEALVRFSVCGIHGALPVGRHAVAGLIIVLFTASSALAWNSKGHMMVAYVAYQRLTPAARARVDDLLLRNPSYTKWEMTIPATISGAEKKLRIFMLAATWPDEIKAAHSGYADDGSDDGSRPNGASSAQNTGYSDHLRHRYWHFVAMPFTSDGSPLPPIPTPNAQDRIHLFRTVLASITESDDLKSYDLTWLLHLVGDVHQPLHVATRVSGTEPDGDHNGSRVAICPAPCKDDLRAFWNTVLGTQATVTAAENLAKTLKAAPTGDGAVLDEAIWVRDSFELAQSTVYKPPVGAGRGPFTITAAYRASAKSVARRQIALAGARLANVLNADLK